MIDPEACTLNLMFELGEDAAKVCRLVQATPAKALADSASRAEFFYDQAVFDRLRPLRDDDVAHRSGARPPAGRQHVDPHGLAGQRAGQDVEAVEVAAVDPDPADDAGRRPIARPVAFHVNDQLGAADIPAVPFERRHVARPSIQIEEPGELPGALLAIAADPQALCIRAGLAIDDVPALALDRDDAARPGVVAIFGHAARLVRRDRRHLRQCRSRIMPIRESVRLHARACAQQVVGWHAASRPNGVRRKCRFVVTSSPGH